MIRGRIRQREKVPEVKVNLNCSIHNRFDIEVIDAATGNIKQRAQAENVICNALWTKLFTPTTYFNYIHYGTGAGTPAAANTSLFTFLGYGTPATGDDAYTYDWDNGWVSLRRKIQLSESTAVGSTLTEVGIGYNTTAATLCTHAMLKDMNGNQISIAKTSTDIINIYATVFVHWAESGYDSGSIRLISNTTSNFLKWLLGMYASGYVPAYAQLSHGCNLAGTTSRPYIAVTATYNSTAKTATLTLTRLAASSYNVAGGYQKIAITEGQGASSAYSGLILEVGGAWYAQSTVTGEAIGTGDGSTTDFATDFDCPENGTVYVDGVEDATATVYAYPVNNSDMGRYFDGLDTTSTPTKHILRRNPMLSTLRDTLTMDMGKTYYYYNPYYALGISSVYHRECAMYVSDDFETWTQVVAFNLGTGTVAISEAYRYCKYWKIVTDGSAQYGQAFTAANSYAGKTIHFNNVLATGAVITADYTTKTLAKDVNHVFDLSVVITLGEKTT